LDYFIREFGDIVSSIFFYIFLMYSLLLCQFTPPNTRRPTLLNLAPLQANLVALEIPALESYSRGVAALDRAFVLPSPLVIKLIERRLMSSIKVPIAWI